jgi:hypothetical protein
MNRNICALADIYTPFIRLFVGMIQLARQLMVRIPGPGRRREATNNEQ